MKNVTIAVPDEVYRSARIHAAEQGTSISALVRDYLVSLTDDAAEFARLAKAQQALVERLQTTGTFSAADRLSRDEVHDRALR